MSNDQHGTRRAAPHPSVSTQAGDVTTLVTRLQIEPMPAAEMLYR